jgi:hypothetical protein
MLNIAFRTCSACLEEKFAIKPRRLVGDTNYGVAAMLGWLVDEKRIAPHVPVWDKSEHHDALSAVRISSSIQKTAIMFALLAGT